MPAGTSAQIKGYAILVLLVLAGCTASTSVQKPTDGLVRWRAVDSLNARLPADMRVYAGHNDALPIQAWVVRVPARYGFRVLVSDDTTDIRESTSSFARDAGACVAVNGGYFRMGDFPASAVGLLVQNGRITADAAPRAALGRLPGGRYQIGWAEQRGDSLALYPEAPGISGRVPSALPWRPTEALGAGPMLLRAGQYRVTAFEEDFNASSIPRQHPRTAAGVAANGDLLLMVVDGRYEGSRGVDLAELARLMREAGAVDALNLDGGGSSTLVVDGVLVNRPTGGTYEREVMNALVVFCE